MMSEPDKSTENDIYERPPLPPASLEFLVLSLRTQAELHLGLMHFGPEEQRPEPDLPLARHSIDLLGMLQEKTKGNLSLEEQRLLENSLTELRFRYVQALEERKKAPAKKPESAVAETQEGEAAKTKESAAESTNG